jgi:predicted AAA+ superfamily ATPase
LGIDLHIASEEFQRHIIKKRFNELTEPSTLLFDEVHDDDNWNKILKILYDEARTAFILCSGSSALFLNSTADLARRMHTQKIYPFSFTELLHTQKEMNTNAQIFVPETNWSIELKEVLFFSQTALDVLDRLNELKSDIENCLLQKQIEINPLLEKYINFLNFPNLLFFDDEIIITHSILDLFKRIIHEDIPKLKPTFTAFTKIERLILRLADSDEINPEKLAGVIGVKQIDINEIIDILAKAELLNVLLPFGGLDTKIVKNKKAFFMSPSLRGALLSTLYGQNLPDQFRSKLIEDIIVMYLRRVLTDGIISFLSGNDEVNPDFVIETRDKPILLEIGTRKTSLRQLTKSNVKYRYGLLISNGVAAPTLKGDCIQIPLSWFLLL